MPPEPTARLLAKEYETLEELEDCLIVYSRRPVKERAFANLYANTGGQKNYTMTQYTRHIAQSEDGQFTPTAPWYDSKTDTIQTVATMRKDSTVFIITGDSARNKVQVMPGGGHSTAKVDVPSKWDSLMSTKGYPELESFFLSNSLDTLTPISSDTTSTEPTVTPTDSTTVNPIDPPTDPTTSTTAIVSDNSPISYNGKTIINEERKNMVIYDATGKMVDRTNSHYNTSSLPSGVYLVYVSGYRGVACKIIKP